MYTIISVKGLQLLLLAAVLQVAISELPEISANSDDVVRFLNVELQGNEKDIQSEYISDPQGKDVDTSTLPRSCKEALGLQGNGVYSIYLPDSGLKPFQVYCLDDEQNETPWTVIQRRVTAYTDFYRNWEDYKRGFGDLQSNFFIGLDKLHALTSDPNNHQELWIQLKSNVTVDGRYSRFEIGNEFELYKLKKLGDFVGIAGDSLKYHQGMNFTTYDYDNDMDANKNCAKFWSGGWWYNNCMQSDLNGIYGENNARGIYWKTLNQDGSVILYAQMAIRSVHK